jgi:hypothetical protein
MRNDTGEGQVTLDHARRLLAEMHARATTLPAGAPEHAVLAKLDRAYEALASQDIHYIRARTLTGYDALTMLGEIAQLPGVADRKAPRLLVWWRARLTWWAALDSDARTREACGQPMLAGMSADDRGLYSTVNDRRIVETIRAGGRQDAHTDHYDRDSA